MPTEIQSLNQTALKAVQGNFDLESVSTGPIGPTKPVCPLDCCPTNGLE